MIPSMPAFMGQGLAIREQPSRTYGMNMEDGTVQGYVDGLEAMRQAERRMSVCRKAILMPTASASMLVAMPKVRSVLLEKESTGASSSLKDS